MYGTLRRFQRYFGYIAAASAPVHAFLEIFLNLYSVQYSFPGHWLISHITIVEAMDSGERGMNPVAMTILGKNTDRAGDRTSDLLFSSPQRYRLSYRAWQILYGALAKRWGGGSRKAWTGALASAI